MSNLNTYRAWLATGGRLNSTHNVSANYKYDAYVEADFTSGGMENADGVTKEVALLREILEERYISLYGSFSPFNDHRRLRGDGESNLIVPFPLNTLEATRHVERFPYAQSEKNSNSNVPVIADQEALYQLSHPLGTTLQVNQDMWPKDLDAFEAYWRTDSRTCVSTNRFANF